MVYKRVVAGRAAFADAVGIYFIIIYYVIIDLIYILVLSCASEASAGAHNLLCNCGLDYCE